MLEFVLHDAGFATIAAHSGEEAAAMLDEPPDAFAGLVTDIDLGGGIDGWRLARQARALGKNMPVVYISGGSAQDWIDKGVADSVMIGKPFTPEQIIDAVKSTVAA